MLTESYIIGGALVAPRSVAFGFFAFDCVTPRDIVLFCYIPLVSRIRLFPISLYKRYVLQTKNAQN